MISVWKVGPPTTMIYGSFDALVPNEQLHDAIENDQMPEFLSTLRETTAFVALVQGSELLEGPPSVREDFEADGVHIRWPACKQIDAPEMN